MSASIPKIWALFKALSPEAQHALTAEFIKRFLGSAAFAYLSGPLDDAKVEHLLNQAFALAHESITRGAGKL